MNGILRRINLAGLVPVVVIDEPGRVVPAAKALLDGGLDCMEITLRTQAAIDAIKAVRNEYPDMLVGAGTVLGIDEAKQSIQAGAQFIVSPGLNPDLVSWCSENDIPVTPGCVTPTEIEWAMKLGLNVLKFFPAGIYGGIKGCKALHGPYRTISFIPTGGVSLNNLHEYVDKPYIHAVGGSWLCPSDCINNGNYEMITNNTSDSIKILLGFDPDNAPDEVQTYFKDRAVYYMQKRGYEIQPMPQGSGCVHMRNNKTGRTVNITGS